MYHTFVRSRFRSLFNSINEGDAEPVLRAFAPGFEHTFQGNHALSGTRTTLPATREWYARLFRLLPGIHFDLGRIWVSGGPWNTIAVIEWSERNDGADGIPCNNTGIHAVELKWGRATKCVICPHKPLEPTLARVAEAGIAEAAAPPILD